MRITSTFHLLLVLAITLAASPAAQASAISGALPFVAFNVTETAPDLSSPSNVISATSSETSGPGLGDFAIVPLNTQFGAFTYDVSAASTGGGFAISNATYGTFVGGSGAITFQAQDVLTADIFGVFTPGTAYPTLAASPAEIDIAFTWSRGVVSASFSGDTQEGHGPQVPEPQTLVLAGFGIVACVTSRILRRALV